jgi:predicted ATPase
MSQEPFIQKLTLRNFRSIRNETVTFTNPLFLVGRNGSGKSNFVDALAFLAECMTTPLQSVVEQWGGLGRICHFQTPLDAPSVYFHVNYQLSAKQRQQGVYAFALRITPQRNFVVSLEHCSLSGVDGNPVWFNRTEDAFTTSIPGIQPVLSSQALAMPLLGGTQDLSAVYQSLAAMKLYRIQPEQVGGIQGQTSTTTLKFDGSNITTALLHLSELKQGKFARVRELLHSVVPGVSPLEPSFSNGQSVLHVEQDLPNSKAVLEAAVMSAGTLNALGLVVVALQEPVPSLIAIEEPELNIHPGALEAIADIIKIAAQRTQVIVTTHSPDLLDTKWIQPENLRVVEWEKGATHISELGEAPVKALQRHLMGAGELLRANALDAAAPKLEDNSDLFQETKV